MNIGIDIGGTHIAIAVVEKSNIILQKEKVYNHDFKINLLNSLENFIKDTITDILQEYKIEKIGISIAGTIQDNVLLYSTNLGLKNIDFRKILEPYFNIPVTVNKDSFCAGRAEKEYGCLKGYDNNSIFLIIGTGIGGIRYLDGNIYRAGYGHMVIEKNGKQCKCGKKGCFETYASIKVLRDKIKEHLNVTDIDGKQLHEYLLLNKQDKEISKILDNYIYNFCIGLTNIIDIDLPEVIGFGGSFSYYDDIFIDKIKETIANNNLLLHKTKMPILKMGELKNDAGIIGATCY